MRQDKIKNGNIPESKVCNRLYEDGLKKKEKLA
jgi:hypothetical protein